MTLRETVRTIRATKGWTQRGMAAQMGVDFQTIQRAENAGRNLEKQYTFFIKLLRFLPAKELHPTAPEVIQHGLDGFKTQKDGPKKTLKAKAPGSGAISTGRHKDR